MNMKYRDVVRTLQQEFEEAGALWVHDDNPNRPHALLTSGKHSNGFFNGTKIIEATDKLLIERAISVMLPIHDIRFKGVTRVVGSERGAVEISYELAKQLKVKHSTTAKTESGMELQRFSLLENDKLLIAEDVMSTGSTTIKTINGLMAAGEGLNISFLPKLVVLVNRSGMKTLKTPHGEFEICPLLDIPMPMWEPDECPLCKKGSEAIKPKGNWDKLTADLAA